MKIVYLEKGHSHALEIERAGEKYEVEINGERAQVRVLAIAPPRITFRYKEEVITAHIARDGKRRWIHIDGSTFVLERGDATLARAHAHGAREGTGSGRVVAPMPGQVRAVLVNEGDEVAEGEPVLLLEAMKMEIRVTAPVAGRVGSLTVKNGDSVEHEQVLGEIVSDEEIRGEE